MRLTDTVIQKITEECDEALAKAKIADTDVEDFLRTTEDVLSDYQSSLGEDRDVTFRVRKRMGRVELSVIIAGEKLDPFEQGTGAEERSAHRTLSALLLDPGTTVSYLYSRGRNVVLVRSAVKRESRNILKQPMVIAVIAGLVAGLVCQALPAPVSAFVVNDLASPVLKVVLGVLAGIMGPVIFLSLVTAVNSLDDIEELNALGGKVFKRFMCATLFIAVVAIVVAAFFFPVFGAGGVAFDPHMIVELILSVIPTNLVTPFVENNTPQIVVLGICMGQVLLLLGRKVEALSSIVSQLREWVNGLMSMALRLTPIVPFLSVFKLVAQGNFAEIAAGWKYILATYICLAICMVVKFAKVSVVCKTSPRALWQSLSPISLAVFAAGSELVSIKKFNEVSRKDFGIDPNFTSFWLPMNQALFAPGSTISFALAPFLVAELTTTPISLTFLLVLLMLVMELSLASPGLTAGWTILLTSLGMSAEYVGLFSAYGVVIKNVAAAFGATYRALEQIEAAYTLGAMDREHLQGLKEGD